MPKKLSPATIITLLKKAKTVYQKASPNPKDEAETRHRKINEDLKLLRRFAQQEKNGAELEQDFEARKLQCVNKLKLHYQKLKRGKASDPNKEQLPKYLTALGKLTLSVKRLKYMTLDDIEENNLNPEALENEDLSEMDGEVAEGAATDGQAAATPASPAAETAAALRQRLNALTASFQSALAAKVPQAPLMVILYNAVNEDLQKQAYESAATSLDQLEPLLRAAAATAKPTASDQGLAFNARLKALMPLVLAARQANPVRAAELSLGVNEAKTLATKRDYLKANSRLDVVEKLLGARPAAPAPDGAAVMQRFHAIAGDLKGHLAGKGPDLPRIKALATAVSGLLKSKDYTLASRSLDELEPLLKNPPVLAPQPDQQLLTRCQNIRIRLELEINRNKELRSHLLPLYESMVAKVMKGHPTASDEVNAFEGLVNDAANASGTGPSAVYKEFEQWRTGISKDLVRYLPDPGAAVYKDFYGKFDQAVRLADRKDDGKTQQALAAIQRLGQELHARAPELLSGRVPILLARIDKKLKGDDVGLLDPAARISFLKQYLALKAANTLPADQRCNGLNDLDARVSGALTDRLVELTGFIADLERVEPHLTRAVKQCAKTNWNDLKARLQQGQQNFENGFGGAAIPLPTRQKGLSDLQGLIKQFSDRYRDEVLKPKHGARADQWERLELRETVPVPAKDLAVGRELGRGAFGGVYRLNGPGGASTAIVGKTAGTVSENDLLHEEKIYARLGDHPNITKSYGIHKIGANNMLLMKEVKGSDLNKVCDDLEEKFRDKKISREEYLGGVQHLIKGTLKGLAHFESVGLLHRDIKGDNIRYDEETGEPVLIDMGLAKEADEDIKDMSGFQPTFPPEVAQLGKALNVWDSFAVGKMLFPLLEQLPDSPQKFQFIAGLRDASPARRDYGSYMSPSVGIIDNLKKTLTKDSGGNLAATTDDEGNLIGQTLKPARNPDAPDPGEFGALTTYVDFMNQLTHPDPAQRLKPSDALKHPFMTQALAEDADRKKLFGKEPEGPAAPPPAAPPLERNAASDGVEFQARLKALGPRILKTVGFDPELTEKLRLAVKQAVDLAKQPNYVEAAKMLDEVESLLEEPKYPASERFDALAAKLEFALAAGGPDRARIEALAAAVKAMIQGGDHAQAEKALDELESLLKKPPGMAPPDRDDVNSFKNRLTALVPRARQVKNDYPVFGTQLLIRLNKAIEMLNATNVVGGLKALDEMESHMTRGLQLQAQLAPLEAELNRDAGLKAKVAPLLQMIQDRVNKGDDKAGAAIVKLQEMVDRVKATGGAAAPTVFKRFEKLRNDVAREMEVLVENVPAERKQDWANQFETAKGLADPKDDDKTQMAITALQQLQAALQAQSQAKAPELVAPRTNALLTRLAKALKGTDGGLLDPVVRADFLRRLQTLEAGTALPPDRRLQDADDLDEAVTKAVAERESALASLMGALDAMKQNLRAALELCTRIGKIDLQQALVKKFDLFTMKTPASFATLSLEERQRRVPEIQAQIDQILSQNDLAVAREDTLQRFNKLGGKLGLYLTVGGPNLNEVQKLARAIRRSVKKREFAKAWERLDKLEPLLETPATGGAPSPTAANAFNANLRRLRPIVQQAQQANPTLAGELQRRLDNAVELAHRQEFVQAGSRLIGLEQVLAVAAAAAPGGDEVQQRFNAIIGDINAHLGAAGPDSARIDALAKSVNTLFAQNNFAGASQALDALEPLVLKPLPPPPVAAEDLDGINGRLVDLEPRIVEVRKDDEDLGSELDRRVREAIAIANAGDFGQANALLTAVETLLRATAAPSSSGARPEVPAVEALPEPNELRDEDLIQDYPEDEEEPSSGNVAGLRSEGNPYTQMDPADMPALIDGA